MASMPALRPQPNSPTKSFLDRIIKKTQRRHNRSYQAACIAKVAMIPPGGYKLSRNTIVIPALHDVHRNPAV